MNDDQMDDLKQFITTTVSQLTAELRQDSDRIEKKIDQLDRKVDDGFAGAGDSTTEVNDQLADHEQRITKLEAA